MIGYVLKNSIRGMLAAEMENGEYVILELLDSAEPELGDILSHSDFYSLGGETVRNLTQGEKIDVYIQNVCGATQVKGQCML